MSVAPKSGSGSGGSSLAPPGNGSLGPTMVNRGAPLNPRILIWGYQTSLAHKKYEKEAVQPKLDSLCPTVRSACAGFTIP